MMCKIRSGEWLSDVSFKLYDRDSDGNIIHVWYKGGWRLVDNGYQTWSTAVPPMKMPITDHEDRFSR